MVRALVSAMVGLAVFGVGSTVIGGAGSTSGAAGGDRAGVLESAVRYTPERAGRLIAHRDRAIRACMRDAGFGWRPEPADPQLLSSPRGLFGAETPSAVEEYRREWGYGVARLVPLLRRASADFAAEPEAATDQAAARLRTCGDRARQAVGPDPAAGGALGRAYRLAVDDLPRQRVYADFADAVAGCMREAGEQVDRLESAADPFLMRLVDLVGGGYHRDPQGRLRYEIGSTDPTPFRLADLRALRRDELRRARVEVRCRRAHDAAVIGAWSAVSEPLLEEFPSEVSALAAALEREEG